MNLCPRCGGAPGPRPSDCPGCRDVCKARHRGETTPCGKPTGPLLYAEFPKNCVRMCQRHFDLFMEDALADANRTIARLLGVRF